MTDEPFSLAALLLCRMADAPRMAETLLSLAAQSDPDFEIHLIVADGASSQMREWTELVGTFDDEFATRVNVIDRDQVGSETAFGCGVARSKASYVATLYPDDVVFAHWAETFAIHGRRAGGRALSSLVATQVVDEVYGDHGRIVTTVERPKISKPFVFDLMEHLVSPPIHLRGLALPRLAVQRMVVQRVPPAAEGWAAVLAAGLSCGIAQTGAVTHLRRLSLSADRRSFDAVRWADDRRAALEALGRCDLTVGPDFLPSLRSSIHESLETEVDVLHEQLRRAEEASRSHAAAERDARDRVAALLSSASWRASAPLRALGNVARRLGRRTRTP